ncbi:DUF2339 domain-containing protein [uncultured Alsobacter sp.]|uniref:DUF2339 domain-containing protein n=1 Tax=uncultured Alsobacter sp. TaxID=1748258 RepID=UPI0025CB988A|nr:DUF2339 domain-containing protein [uncultured Alsobacter sp.]
MEWVILVLIALAIPILGFVGFFIAVGARNQGRETLARLERLEAALKAAGLKIPDAPLAPDFAPAGEPTPQAAPAASETAFKTIPTPDAVAPEPIEVFVPASQPNDVASEPESAVAPPPPLPPPAGPRPSLEERIGTRWVVWVGGLALGLGGLFLVRFAIDEGFFGPGARIAAGTLFALGLLAAGEWMRRRESGAPVLRLGLLPPAPIPAVLTAAGTLTAFGTAYAAHALYGMIGPALAFILLGAIALATLAAAALHGPALAAVGIVASYGAPFLVSSSEPNAWPVILYVGMVAAAGYGLSRVRLWIWLAAATLAGAGVWTFVLAGLFAGRTAELTLQFAVQTALAAGFLVLAPHRGDEDDRPDPLAPAALGVFAALACIALQAWGFGLGRPLLAGVVVALVWGTALRVPAAAAGGLMSGLVALAALWAWPVVGESAAEPVTVLPGAPSSPPMPDALWLFLMFTAATAGALALGALARLARSAGLRFVGAGLYAAAGTAGPLALLVMAWWRVADFDRSIPFALVAGAMALAYAGAAAVFQRQEAQDPTPASVCGVEATAAAALGALAAGLTMVLDKGALTVALALTAAGAAWVTTRRPVGTLRYAVGVMGVILLARLAWNPTVVAGDPGSMPVLNWLLWGYGVPAVAFAAASVLLRRQRDDQVVALAEALALIFAWLLVSFEIRHAVNGALDVRAPGHVEAGLQVFATLGFALGLLRLEVLRRSLVLRLATYLFGVMGLAGAVAGLMILDNPLLDSSERVFGGLLLNTLLPGYLLPAIAAVLLGRTARGKRARWFVLGALALGFVLHFLWMVMAVRHAFHGLSIPLWRSTSDAEGYTYSAVFLLTGLALLAIGIVLRSAPARLASALYVLLTVGKVFLLDMSGLEGAWRALSFIGLGLALVGIGLVYQKFVFVRPPAPPEDQSPSTASADT